MAGAARLLRHIVHRAAEGAAFRMPQFSDPFRSHFFSRWSVSLCISASAFPCSVCDQACAQRIGHHRPSHHDPGGRRYDHVRLCDDGEGCSDRKGLPARSSCRAGDVQCLSLERDFAGRRSSIAGWTAIFRLRTGEHPLRMVAGWPGSRSLGDHPERLKPCGTQRNGVIVSPWAEIRGLA